MRNQLDAVTLAAVSIPPNFSDAMLMDWFDTNLRGALAFLHGRSPSELVPQRMGHFGHQKLAILVPRVPVDVPRIESQQHVTDDP